MNARKCLAVTRRELIIVWRDPLPKVALILMPIGFAWVAQRVSKVVLLASGTASSNGAEQVVPGMTVAFSFFVVTDLSLMFMREHLANTWDDLRASPISNGELFVGKACASFLVAMTYFTLIYYTCALLFGLPVGSGVLGVLVVGTVLTLVLMALGLLLFTISSTYGQLNALVTVIAGLSGGAGGTIVPREFLPPVLAKVSPYVPSYWAMRALQPLGAGDSLSVLIKPVTILLAMGAALLIVAFPRLRNEGSKVA